MSDLHQPAPPSIGQIFSLFGGVALAGVGGGLPAHIRRALLARGWITDEQFAETFTLAQLTPGPNAVNLAAMIGVHMAGWRGLLAAVAGILWPGLLVMLAVSAYLFGSGHSLPPALQGALHGAAAAAVAILLSAGWPVLRVAVGVRGGLALTALTFVLIGILRVDLLWVLPVVVSLGWWLNQPTVPQEGTR